MVHKSLRAVIIGALMTVGYLGAAPAAPIAPAAIATLNDAPVKLVSYWGRPFPWGYAYYPGQCYSYVQVETPSGLAWRRVFICTETHGHGYGHGYNERF